MKVLLNDGKQAWAVAVSKSFIKLDGEYQSDGFKPHAFGKGLVPLHMTACDTLSIAGWGDLILTPRDIENIEIMSKLNGAFLNFPSQAHDSQFFSKEQP